MKTRSINLGILLALLLIFSTTSLFATHCQIHGSVRRGSHGPNLAGWKIVKTPVEGFGMDTVETDALGGFQFIALPGNVTYRIHPIFPDGWIPIDAVSGKNTVNGDSGEASTSTRVDNMTLDVFVKNGSVNSNNTFVVETPADTVKYRTAMYPEWAAAKDGKGKRKAIKCKPDKVQVKLVIIAPKLPNNTGFVLKFSMPFTGYIYADTLKSIVIDSVINSNLSTGLLVVLTPPLIADAPSKSKGSDQKGNRSTLRSNGPVIPRPR